MAKKIIKARLKQRTDTQANWAANNPVLLEGELGLVTDDKNLYKVGDGVTAWNDLPFRGFDGTLVHETGDSDNAAMSQRGVTRALAKLEENMADNDIIKELSRKIEQLAEENTRLKERIEEQDVFIEDLEYHKLTANSDNRYPDISVGTADNLAGVDVVDSEINFRRSGGGAISDGVARIETIKGNSVVWNQLMPKATKSTTMNDVTFTVNADGSIVANGTASATAYIVLRSNYTDASHKYAVFGTPNGGSNITYYFGDGNALNDRGGNGTIANGRGLSSTFACRVQSGVTANNVVYRPRLIDLTKMFGSGNEPTTIEEFYARIPMGVDLNAYNEGEVIHMDVQSVESQGVNAWDEEWEEGIYNVSDGTQAIGANQIRNANLIPVLPNTEYYLSGNFSFLAFLEYGADKKFLRNRGGLKGNAKTSEDCHYLAFYTDSDYGLTYNRNICINLSDTSINGKYFPYIKRVEDLAVIRKYFPQGMKSAPTAHDAIRYNKESGKWEKVEATGIRAYQEGDADNALYLTDGKVTCYPLAEPIVTELDEADQFKDLDYQVWNAGTEKAIAEGKSAPLAADITYGFNAIGKIKELESLVAALRAKVGI